MKKRKILPNGKTILEDIWAAQAVLNGNDELKDLYVTIDDKKLPYQFIKKYSRVFSCEDFDEKTLEKRKNTYFMPEKYKNINLEKYFLSLAKTKEEKERIKKELSYIHKTKSEDFFRYLIYLADIIKEHGIIIGTGRGSSVSLYILFLLGLHRVNSLKYELDPNEFFKMEKEE